MGSPGAEGVVDWHDLSSLGEGVRLYGVLGYPIAHSLSPPMQEAAFRAAGIPARYLRVEVPEEDLGYAVQELLAAGFCGWNCTLPLKRRMLDFVDPSDAWVALLGSVNTVQVQGRRLLGFHTDGPGWEEALREEFGVELPSMRVLVVGAGGTGSALARYAVCRGCPRVVVTSRNASKAQGLALALKNLASRLDPSPMIEAIPWEPKALACQAGRLDLLVHATPLGLGDPGVIPPYLDCLFEKELLVYDVVYGRSQPTPLVKAARAAGLRAADGLSMLLYQGALAFRYWTGCQPPLSAMREALYAAAGRKFD
jgi:shikimate dehydrogenase